MEGLEVRRARFFDARNLGVGGGSGEVNGAGVDGFGVACPARARGVLGNGLEEVDVTVASSADGRWDGACNVEKGAAELLAGLEVVLDVVDQHDDGLCYGRFGGTLRCDAGGGAHSGGGDGDGVGFL